MSVADAAEKVYSIEEFNGQKAEWDKWVDQPLKVEGQVVSFSGKNQFRLKLCELPFHLSDANQLRAVDVGQNVELTGWIRKESGKLIFVASRAKVLGSHIEQYSVRESKLKSDKPEDWYDLADWAAARGKFYEDNELLIRGRRAREKGLQLERAGLPAGDAQARIDLAKKIHEHHPDEAIEADLIHEAGRLKWEQSKTDRARQELFTWLAEQFPISQKPLAEFPAELNRRYETNPLGTFRDSEPDVRRQLARLFAVEVELARILPRARADHGNALEIADELASRTPERTDLIEKYRELGLKWRLGSIATAPRLEALRLADILKERGKPDEAIKLLSSWIRSQEAQLPQDDPVALLQLADDYLQLVDNQPAAAKLLIAAHKIDPSLDEAGNRLKELGYRWEQDRWTKADSASATGAGKLPQLKEQMTTEEVRKLLGKPAGISRVVTGKGVEEAWSFGPSGTPRLLVLFRGPRGGSSLKVERFLTEQR